MGVNDVNNGRVKSVDVADYKKLYYTAFNRLGDLHATIEDMQKELEALALQESELAAPSLVLLPQQTSSEVDEPVSS